MKTSVALVVLLVGCSGETTAPAPSPVPTTPRPEPTATAGLDAGAAPLVVQPLCAPRQGSRALRGLPLVDAWYAAPCPTGMHVELCNGSESSPGEPLPDACSWFDGQPQGMSPACCPSGDTLPLTCDLDADCPASGAECWEPWCNAQTHQCGQTFAFKRGEPCAGGAGICNLWGAKRGEVDGLRISEEGGPAVCDVPQLPD